MEIHGKESEREEQIERERGWEKIEKESAGEMMSVQYTFVYPAASPVLTPIQPHRQRTLCYRSR